MRRFSLILTLLACLALRPAVPAHAWFFDDNTLVSIDGTKYTADDFKQWWKFWNDDGKALSPTPDPYVDFLLLTREAQRMELAETPQFKRQTRIFVQSRALGMLRHEAVNSQIKVTDEMVKSSYWEKYQPVWTVQRLEFKDEKAANEAWQELAKGKLTVTDLLARKAEQGGPVASQENDMRPNQVDPGWAAIFKKTAVGGIVDPADYNKGPFLFLVKDQKAGSEQEFEKMRKQINDDLWRLQASELTEKLLFQLRDKYQVKVDQERLAALDLKDYDSGNFSDAPVITSTRQNVSEKQFMAVIARLVHDRETLVHEITDKKMAEELKKSTVNNIIAQSVTNWECLDRHYEQKEPFKPEYDFNYDNRLYLALEQRLFTPKIEVSEDEIKQYFQENSESYMQPAMVKVYIVDETQGPLDKIWADVAMGKNFDQEVKKEFGINAKVYETPVNHLDPEVKAVVVKMVVGETSKIFKAQGIRVLAHLVERTPARPLPLERVQSSIRSIIWNKKLDQVRNAYLDQLKSRSKIEVRERQWKTIQKELGGAS